ncbi:MAG: 50S ribosomal protein L9 [Gammaproteobacteria bacterium SG8_47]|nr:MAG: 50S ribosomal protein L9 [Gammaproteobacteria bacterium SG8_47]
MEVILLERIRNLGELGETVKVRPGYGRNYLIPAGKAVAATKDNVAKFEARRAELEQAAAETLAQAQARAEQIAAIGRVVITCRAGDEGKLFGSVTAGDIARVVSEAGAAVEKREVALPTGPIRQVGEFELELQLHSDVTAPITVVVEPE